MSNWEGAARSNYVRIKNMEGLVKSLKPFEIKISEGSVENEGKVSFISEDEYGGWPSNTTDEDSGEEVIFNAAEHICTFMEDGEVLVMLEAGHEKMRYITGMSIAYNSKGQYIQIDLDNIYDMAAKKFSVKRESITSAAY